MSKKEALKRATVFENGCSSGSKVVAIPTSLEEFLITLRDRFSCPDFSVVYTSKGGQIIDTSVIK